MTTEDDFHRALDRRRTDWQTRLVLADWLDEHGTTPDDRLRAIGYRKLGELRRWPFHHEERPSDSRSWQFLHPEALKSKSSRKSIKRRAAELPFEITGPKFVYLCHGYAGESRRELEDRVARGIGLYLTSPQQT